MKRFAFIATLMMATAVTAAQAEPIADQVVRALTEQGYTRIEVKNRPGEVKVEAIRNGQQLEVVYDAQTGAILKQESRQVRAGDDTTPGVTVRNEDDDGVRGNSEDHRMDDFGQAQREARSGDDSDGDRLDDSNDDDRDSAENDDDKDSAENDDDKDSGKSRGRDSGSDDRGDDDHGNDDKSDD